MPAHNILVAGATGRQGRALIHALRPITDSEEPGCHVLALTRDAESPSAMTLANEKHVTLVEGDLDKPETIKPIFEQPGRKIWGVYCVLAFLGLGANPDGEERQGKMLADLALEHDVSLYMYSSSDHGKEGIDRSHKYHNQAKVRIERHVCSLGERGLPWCILRPGFFMENYEGIIGSVTAATLLYGLAPDTTLQLIAVDDIGRMAATIFRDPSSGLSQAILVVSERLTMSQQRTLFKEVTNRNLTSLPGFVARFIIAMNQPVKDLLAEVERNHTDYINGENSTKDAQMKLANTLLPDMLTFKAWAAQRKSSKPQRKKGWNHISLVRLLTGRQ